MAAPARSTPVPPQSQPVTSAPFPAAIFLVATVNPGGEALTRTLLADVAGLRRAVGFQVPGSGLEVITSIGSHVWDRLFTGPRPARLHPFEALHGDVHHAPSTPGDLFFHIRAMSMDVCFETARRIVSRLHGAAVVVDEVHGFRYLENRDLIGFVDGTENPAGGDAIAAVVVGDEDPDFAGGSYVHIQRYVHKMREWDAVESASRSG
ncbi:Dyp-type peroxidase family [Rhodococcus sp. 27YEA15]